MDEEQAQHKLVDAATPPTRCRWFRQGLKVTGLVACSLALILVIRICALCLLQTARHRQGANFLISPDCMLPLGGGAAQKMGNFPHFSYPNECKDQLADYFDEDDGYYYLQVLHVASAAIAYMSQLMKEHPPSPDQVFVFDIDETTLSNAAEWKSTKPVVALSHKWLPSLPLPASAATSMLAPQVNATAGVLAGGLPAALRDDGDADGPQPAESPPLVAVRDLYWWLLEHNYSCAFITGRKEPTRAATVKNLVTAGYGKQCSYNDNERGTPTSPCYVALHLRDKNDDRPASVYKPERRKELMDAGYTVVGNIGDQFSDLEGLWVAESSWKLPNPMYYIL